MSCDKISAEIAYNIRFERGLALPTNKQYENTRIAEIAKRQKELMEEYVHLGIELRDIYQETLKQ